MARSFSQDYQEAVSGACKMLGGNYRDAEHRKSVICEIAKQPRDSNLAQALKLSNASLTPSATRDLNIERLVAPGSVAVVTGQQVGLFCGPSFTLYKALSAVVAARQLEHESGVPCVPVFWIQNQDHDLAEINQAVAPDAKGNLELLGLDEPNAAANRVSLAHYPINESATVALSSLNELIGRFPYGQDILNTLSKYYQPGETYSSAFAKSLAELTADHGLIFFDPSLPELLSSTQPLYQRAFDSYADIAQTLLKQGEVLASTGYDIQVHVRKDSPLFFVHPEGPKSPRYRIERSTDGWNLIGSNQKLSEAELSAILTEHSAQLSPSALLRPLIQDSILPSAAYLAGNAEINYFAQISPLYEMMNVSRPLVIPRSSITCVDNKHQRWLDQLQLSVTQLNHSDADLRSELLRNRDSVAGALPEELRQSVDAKLLGAVTLMEEAFGQVDRTLLGALGNSRKKISHQINSLLTKYEKALTEADKTTQQRVEKMRNSYFPKGIPQERVLSAVYYLARFGNAFTDMVVDAINPLDDPHTEIDVN